MKNSIGSIFIVLAFLILLASACAPAPTSLPTSIPPTSTSLPTETSAPTKTPVPTKTPIPPTATVQAPDKASEFLNGVQVVYLDTFDDPSRGGWGFDAGKVKGGVLEVMGKNWNGLFRERDFKDNQGVIIDFTFTKGSVFEMLMDSGEWNTDPYKRFGIYMEKNAPMVNVWVKSKFLGGSYLSGNLKPQPDTTYTVLMVLLPDGGFLSTIWDPADPSKALFYRELVGKNWANLTWKFRIGADSGTILFDNYREITFDSVK